MLEYIASFSSISENYDPVFSHIFPLFFPILFHLYVLLAAHILADVQALL